MVTLDYDPYHSAAYCPYTDCPICLSKRTPMSDPKNKLCTICKLPCISMCPACKLFVHPSYGQNDKNCGGVHEAACPESKAFRTLPKKPLEEKGGMEIRQTVTLRKVQGTIALDSGTMQAGIQAEAQNKQTDPKSL